MNEEWRAVPGHPGTPGMECRHFDGDPANNRLLNLAWGSRAENEADKALHGHTPRGEANCNARLTTDQVVEIKEALAPPLKRGTYTRLARSFGVHRRTIYSIDRGLTWTRELRAQRKGGAA